MENLVSNKCYKEGILITGNTNNFFCMIYLLTGKNYEREKY
jgi:hypothetical protein